VSAPDDEITEMRRPLIDLDDAEALLSGTAVPPGLEDLAGLLQSARLGPTHAGDPLESVAVAAMTRPTVVTAPKARAGRRGVLVAKALTAKAVAALVVALLGGVAVAAAAGVLPAPLQSTIARGFHRVGVSIPGAPRSPGRATTATTSSSGGAPFVTVPATTATERPGPGTTDAAPLAGADARTRDEVVRLCRAYRADASAIAAGATPELLVRLDALAGASGPARYCATALAAFPLQRRAEVSPREARASTGVSDHAAGTAGGRSSGRTAGAGHATGSGRAAGTRGSAGSGHPTGTPGGSNAPASSAGSSGVRRRASPHRGSAAAAALSAGTRRAPDRHGAGGLCRSLPPAASAGDPDGHRSVARRANRWSK